MPRKGRYNKEVMEEIAEEKAARNDLLDETLYDETTGKDLRDRVNSEASASGKSAKTAGVMALAAFLIGIILPPVGVVLALGALGYAGHAAYKAAQSSGHAGEIRSKVRDVDRQIRDGKRQQQEQQQQQQGQGQGQQQQGQQQGGNSQRTPAQQAFDQLFTDLRIDRPEGTNSANKEFMDVLDRADTSTSSMEELQRTSVGVDITGKVVQDKLRSSVVAGEFNSLAEAVDPNVLQAKLAEKRNAEQKEPPVAAASKDDSKEQRQAEKASKGKGDEESAKKLRLKESFEATQERHKAKRDAKRKGDINEKGVTGTEQAVGLLSDTKSRAETAVKDRTQQQSAGHGKGAYAIDPETKTGGRGTPS